MRRRITAGAVLATLLATACAGLHAGYQIPTDEIARHLIAGLEARPELAPKIQAFRKALESGDLLAMASVWRDVRPLFPDGPLVRGIDVLLGAR